MFVCFRLTNKVHQEIERTLERDNDRGERQRKRKKERTFEKKRDAKINCVGETKRERQRGYV